MTPKELLLAELKAEGLEITEEVALKCTKALFSAAKKYAAATPGVIDDMVVNAVSMAEPVLLAFADKIDGQVG